MLGVGLVVSVALCLIVLFFLSRTFVYPYLVFGTLSVCGGVFRLLGRSSGVRIVSVCSLADVLERAFSYQCFAHLFGALRTFFLSLCTAADRIL